MDKVRVAMRFLAKYHFWFLAALVVLVSLPLWWRGTSAIAAAYETSKGAIEGSYKKVEGISPDNPNGTFKEAVDKEHEKLKKATQAAWQQQFNLQTPIFVWPDLPGGFRKGVSALKPTEEIPINLRGVYQNNIADKVPEIWERCHVRRSKPLPPPPAGEQPNPAESNPAALNPAMPRIPQEGAPGEPNKEDLMTGVVVWSGRSALESQALGMKARTPSTPEIRFFQEDLWIHEVLLRIVDEVNAQSTEPYNAKIKEITDLRIGQAVAPPVVSTAQPVEDEEGGAAPMRPGPGGGSPFGKGGGGGGDGEEGSAPVDVGAILENNRYVDKAGVQQAAGSVDGHSSGVFKLIPAEMTLTMEEASVPQLLAACANSPIPVEVRKVTVRSRAPSTALAGGAPGGRPGGLPGGLPGAGGPPRAFGPPGGGKGGPGMGKGGGGGSDGEEGPPPLPGFQPRYGAGQGGVPGGDERAEIVPTDVDVYLRVHIYIFNPPDPTKLNLTEAPTEGGDAAPAEAPAAEAEATPPDPSATPAVDPNATPAAETPGAEAAPGETGGPAEGAPADSPPTEEAPMPEGGGATPPAGDETPAPADPAPPPMGGEAPPAAEPNP